MNQAASASANRQKIKAMVHTLLGEQVPDGDAVAGAVLNVVSIVDPEISDKEVQRIIFEFKQERAIRMEPGHVLTHGHVPWLDAKKDSIEWTRWNAYRNLLAGKGINPVVLDAINLRNNIILDLAGDPNAVGKWDRRGLVIGDVQSGKTSNYLALFNKAADAGYKVFILLAGHTEKLRQQTQVRVDEGFIGQDTRKWVQQTGLAGVQANTVIGVGHFSKVKTNFQTTVLNDFSVTSMGTGTQVDGNPVPVVFVVKKNKLILENLTKWLQNHAGLDSQIKAPMMLLDDEADFASINTRRSDDDPTAINNSIRKLLDVFEKNTYVGFTATPFANVLIDEGNKKDLFPRNFIYSLESPTNYFGPTEMFADSESGNNKFIVSTQDAEAVIPFKHKANFSIDALPESLIDALRSFFIVNAIRDLRGQQTSPRSMLVNVSRWVKVQNRVFELLSDKLSGIRAALTYPSASSGFEWQQMKRVFTDQYGYLDESWDEVAEVICNSIDGIEIHVVNSKNKSDEWESVYSGPRARVIAVGGDVLARGLTLEGLSTSYFYRRSLAYDTLMQMGRWFGYRDGYVDLCKLWIDDEVAIWFQDIADALDELKYDLQEMSRRKLEPKDFGLKVRCHPGAMLMVTARNKSLSAVKQPSTVSVWNISKETSRLDKRQTVIEENWKSFTSFIEKLDESYERMPTSNSNRVWWNDVDQLEVGTFLKNYVGDPIEPLFAGQALADFIRGNIVDKLRSWDVIIVGGAGPKNSELPRNISLVGRTVKVRPNEEILYVNGANRRLGGRADMGVVLTKEELAELAAIKNASSVQYRARLKRPILMIYPIQPTEEIISAGSESSLPADDATSYQTFVPPIGSKPLVGINVTFPTDGGAKDPKAEVTYMLSSVWQRLNSITVSAVSKEEESEVDE